MRVSPGLSVASGTLTAVWKELHSVRLIRTSDPPSPNSQNPRNHHPTRLQNSRPQMKLIWTLISFKAATTEKISTARGEVDLSRRVNHPTPCFQNSRGAFSPVNFVIDIVSKFNPSDQDTVISSVSKAIERESLPFCVPLLHSFDFPAFRDNGFASVQYVHVSPSSRIQIPNSYSFTLRAVVRFIIPRPQYAFAGGFGEGAFYSVIRERRLFQTRFALWREYDCFP